MQVQITASTFNRDCSAILSWRIREKGTLEQKRIRSCLKPEKEIPMKSCFSWLVVNIWLFLLPVAAQVGGSGTTNHLPLWTGATNLGNSILIQSGGNIGVGNSSPTAILDVTGKPGIGGTNQGNAPTATRVVGGTGSSGGGAGGPIQFTGGNGGSLPFAVGGTGAIVLINGWHGSNLSGRQCAMQ
jgi:hypothetical protein